MLKGLWTLALLAGMHTVLPAQANVFPEPEIHVSSDQLEQADTLLVIVKNEDNKPSGKIGSLKLHFFRSENNTDWLALIGIAFNKKPGNYELFVKILSKNDFKKNITVLKKDYLKTQLVVTPELKQKGYTQKKIINNLASENRSLGQALIFFTKNAYSPKPFIYPLAQIKITGDFGEIRSGVRHLGTDLKAPASTLIYAINDGLVVLAKKYVNYGNTLVIHHGLGVYSIYLHLSSFNVSRGQFVKQGDVIGLAGDTGYAIGPHLHFSIKVRGATVNPLKFIEASQKYRDPALQP